MVRNQSKFMESAIALFEELNFTRAAQKIHLSQSAVTRNLKKLERAVGVPLFIRNRRSVTVTDACRAYVAQARLSLMYGERAMRAAQTTARKRETVQHVGRSPYIDPFIVSALMSLQLRRFPRLRIELSSQYSCDLVHELLAGGLDLAIVHEPPESPLLTTVKVAEAPFYIAMSEQDPLAGHTSVTLDAMAGRCWILFERRLHPPVYDAIQKLAEQRQIAPAKIQHITDPEEAFPFLLDGSCIAFVVKAGALRIAHNGVTVRPLAEERLSLKTYLASRADNESRVLSELVRAFMRKTADNITVRQLSRLTPNQGLISARPVRQSEFESAPTSRISSKRRSRS
jgi:DNA-binding transcriptional LysR family regulator